MDFSIIIPTANRPDLLLQCVKEVLSQIDKKDVDTEVIISDDSGSESTNQQLRLLFPGIHWINGPRKGPAANRNHAAEKAKGEWLIFIDDDCIPSSGWFDAYLQAVNLEKEIKVFEGKTVALGERKRFDQVAPVNENGGNLWSCNFLIKNNFFIELKGFDESFPYPAMEDVDLCMRIKKTQPIVFLPGAKVSHPWRKMNAFSMFQKHLRSHIILARKHHYHQLLSYRWSRVKIFFGQAISDFLLLKKYSFRGLLMYFENLTLNLFLIFA